MNPAGPSRAAALAGAGAPIALWAVPRSRSTAFARIMIERGDLEVVHEPFSYLIEEDGFTVGGQRAASMPDLLSALLAVNGEPRRLFFKDTSDYQYPELLADDRLYRQVINTFMIRNPAAAVASHHAVNPQATLAEIGFEYLHTMFTAVWAATGEVPLVIDGDDLVVAPEAIVRAYGDHVGLPFKPEAMQWQPGPTHTSWTRTARWHEAVERSHGIVADAPRPVPVDDPHVRALIEHHQPFYDALYAHRLTVDPAPTSS
ncbi:MAG: hypothetical protein ACM30G_09265 [Micromonosporaceae bacterium]